MSLLDQLPRLSAYDPGAAGEGGLDPLGLGAVADRIADVLAPGVRARMSHPRFVTLSAVGAIAYQTLHDLTADDGKTTVDIAFEWLVVEAMVRHPGNGRTKGLPGSQKAARAKRRNERLSRRTYLNGPRVFGFTGVYRPFSRDSSVLTLDDLPGENAERLVAAWEHDFGLNGYASSVAGTRGGQLRGEITKTCKRTLEIAECAAPAAGWLLHDLADYLAPREARANERRVLRDLITIGDHEIRNELTAKLAARPPLDGMSQCHLATQLLPGASTPTRQALQAAIDYENAATPLDNAFRRLVNYTTQQHGAIISRAEALRTPQLAGLAPRIGDLVERAVASASDISNELVDETATNFRLFDRRLTPSQLFDGLLERHDEVQGAKGKLPWLDPLRGEWVVRTPYRTLPDDLHDEVWTHPMRLRTLARFLSVTS